jgi:hypothetical protein
VCVNLLKKDILKQLNSLHYSYLNLDLIAPGVDVIFQKKVELLEMLKQQIQEKKLPIHIKNIFEAITNFHDDTFSNELLTDLGARLVRTLVNLQNEKEKGLSLTVVKPILKALYNFSDQVEVIGIINTYSKPLLSSLDRSEITIKELEILLTYLKPFFNELNVQNAIKSNIEIFLDRSLNRDASSKNIKGLLKILHEFNDFCDISSKIMKNATRFERKYLGMIPQDPRAKLRYSATKIDEAKSLMNEFKESILKNLPIVAPQVNKGPSSRSRNEVFASNKWSVKVIGEQEVKHSPKKIKPPCNSLVATFSDIEILEDLPIVSLKDPRNTYTHKELLKIVNESYKNPENSVSKIRIIEDLSELTGITRSKIERMSTYFNYQRLLNHLKLSPKNASIFVKSIKTTLESNQSSNSILMNDIKAILKVELEGIESSKKRQIVEGLQKWGVTVAEEIGALHGDDLVDEPSLESLTQNQLNRYLGDHPCLRFSPSQKRKVDDFNKTGSGSDTGTGSTDSLESLSSLSEGEQSIQMSNLVISQKVLRWDNRQSLINPLPDTKRKKEEHEVKPALDIPILVASKRHTSLISEYGVDTLPGNDENGEIEFELDDINTPKKESPKRKVYGLTVETGDPQSELIYSPEAGSATKKQKTPTHEEILDQEGNLIIHQITRNSSYYYDINTNDEEDSLENLMTQFKDEVKEVKDMIKKRSRYKQCFSESLSNLDRASFGMEKFLSDETKFLLIVLLLKYTNKEEITFKNILQAFISQADCPKTFEDLVKDLDRTNKK